MKNRHRPGWPAWLLAGGCLIAPAAQAQTASAAIFDARLRHEHVDDDLFARPADASTLRLRLGYRSAVHSGWSSLIEAEGTTHLFGDRYNSSDNGRTGFPAISDPDNAEINQAYVDYAPDPATHLRAGRQRLVYDNQRFIGNSGWRQNEQTFDALDLQHKLGTHTALRYSWLGRVQRVFGADNRQDNLARWLLDAHLFSVAYHRGPGTLTGYGHFIDNRSLPLSSHRNLGLRYAAMADFDKQGVASGLGWTLAAEFARQSPYADGDRRIGASYRLLEGGLVWNGYTMKAGVEELGGDGKTAFQTPLATLHAFNGWADRFLTTPAAGLQDRYLGWNRKWGKVTANLAWHDFRADHGAVHYGREWDASVAWAFAPHWNALVKAADYRADDVGADVGKTWISLEYSR